MAFCNSCGATLDSGTKFCNKCGAAQPAGPAPPTAPGATPHSGNALKIILIAVAVIVGLGILGIGAASFIAWRIASHTHVRNRDGNVRVETPFGTGTMHTAAADFETSDPSSSVAEFYKSKFPGANVMSSSGDHYAIVSTDKKNMLTINIEPKDGKTRIHIAKIAGKIVGGDDSDH
jgi:hypothetical protein